jgi:hypothetical protein
VSLDPFRARGDGTGSSTGRTGHRSTAASIVRRRAELARPLSRGRCAISLGPGAAAHTSAASVTSPRLIHAPRLFGSAGVPPNNRPARIHRHNRRASPPAVRPAMSCDDCDDRGQAEAVTRSSSSLSSAGRQAGSWHSWHARFSGIGVPRALGDANWSWSALVFCPYPDTALCRVKDQLRVDADPRFGGSELADELQGPAWRQRPGPPPHEQIVRRAAAAA